MQSKLVPDDRVLKLNVCSLGVTMLNTDDFNDMTPRMLHTGLGFSELVGEAFEKRVVEAIEEFKRFYHIENVKIYHLDADLYPFSNWRE